MTGTDHAHTGSAAFPAAGMTEAEFRALYERLRRQVPWGPDDRRGALNYITSTEVLAALGEPRLGRTVSLGGRQPRSRTAPDERAAGNRRRAGTRVQPGPHLDEHPRQRRQPRRRPV